MNGSIRNVAPALAQLGKFDVNVDNVVQMVWQPLYDMQDYANAGTQELSFFQVPKGQSGKTLEDTNMTNAGVLPAPKEFLCMGMEIFFHSGAPISTTGADATLGQSQADDLNALVGRGHIQIYIGSKAQLDEVGIEQFPTGTALDIDGSITDTTTAAADRVSHLISANYRGRGYRFEPFRIPANQNFNVDIAFPNGVVAMPSGQDARIGVRLLGWQYRLAQ